MLDFIYRIIDGIARIWRGVCRVFVYAPTVYRSEDWDYCYLYELMEFKIRRMAKYVKEEGHHLHGDRDVKNMLIAAELLKRQREGEYRLKQVIELHEKCPGNSFLERLEERITVDGNTYYVLGEGDPGVARLLRREHTLSKAMEEREFQYLMKILTKHIRNWWD